MDGVLDASSSMKPLSTAWQVQSSTAAFSVFAAVDGTSRTLGSLGNVMVRRNKLWTRRDLQYLLAFQYPLLPTPGANSSQCIARCADDDDDWCPSAPVDVYMFTGQGGGLGFSFPSSVLMGSNRRTPATFLSPLSIQPRRLAPNAVLANTSWSSASLQNRTCGSTQSATIVLSDLPMMSAWSMLAFDVRLRIEWSIVPQAADSLNVSLYGEWLATFTGSDILASLSPSNSNVFTRILSVVTVVKPLPQSASIAENIELAISAAGAGEFCVSSVSLFQRPAVVVYPSTFYVSPPDESSSGGASFELIVATGLAPGDVAVVVPPGGSGACKNLDHLHLLNFPLIVPSPASGLALIPTSGLAAGQYDLCVVPGSISAQAYNSSLCNSKDPTGTFLCHLTGAYTPSGAHPVPDDGRLQSLLMLGRGIPHGLFSLDYFASSVGESSITPQPGDTLNELVWTALDQPDGLWNLPVGNMAPSSVEWLQYFAVALFVPVTQTVSFNFRFCNSLKVYLDGLVIFLADGSARSSNCSSAASDVYSSGLVRVASGWHQVVGKVWIAPMVMTGLLSIAIKGIEGGSWAFYMPSAGNGAGNVNFTDSCASGGGPAVPCLLSGVPPPAHDECVALGCCFSMSSATNWTCSMPSTAIEPYRTDGKCGASWPALGNTISQCNPLDDTKSCCSLNQATCGIGYSYCNCPQCANYGYLAKAARSSFVFWGANARCANAFTVPLGLGDFGTCAYACNVESACTAFSLSSAGIGGGDCTLFLRDACDVTVTDSKSAVLYIRRRANCGFPEQRQGVDCPDTSVTNPISGANISLAACVALCNLSTTCAGVQFRSGGGSRTPCSFLSSNCSQPLRPTGNAGDVFALFRCDNDSLPIPTPQNVSTEATVTFSLTGCFPLPQGLLACDPSASASQGLYAGNYQLMPNMSSVASCVGYCSTRGAMYASVANGTLCTCGVMVSSLVAPVTTQSQPNLTQCDSVACPNGNGSERCGGTGTTTTFKLDYSAGWVCPTGSFYLNGTCFQLVVTPMNFTVARASCAKTPGSALTSIHSLLESQFLLGLLSAAAGGEGAGGVGWVGGLVSSGGSVSWVDSSPEDFSDWSTLQISNSTLAGCLAVEAAANEPTPLNGSWSNSIPCSRALPSICRSAATFNTVDSPPTFFATLSDRSLACAPPSSLGGSLVRQNLQAWYSLDYGSHFAGDVVPDNTPLQRPLRAVFNSTQVSQVLQFVANSVIGSALQFSGRFSLEAEDAWSVLVNPGGMLTVSMWIQPSWITMEAKAGDGSVVVAGQEMMRRNGDFNVLWALSLEPNSGDVCFQVGVSSRACSSSMANESTSLGWMHIAGVFDGVTVQLYINGSHASNASFAGSLASAGGTTQPLTIGYRSSAAHQPFDAMLIYVGLMDDVRLFSSALDTLEVNYLSTCTPRTAPDSVLSIFSGAGSTLMLHGEAISSAQSLLLSTAGCRAGNSVTDAGLVLPGEDEQSSNAPVGGRYLLRDADMNAPPPSSLIALQLYSLCFVNSADAFFIAADSAYRLAVVSVTSIASASAVSSAFSSSGGSDEEILDFTSASFPVVLSVQGVNLQSGQSLFLSYDSNCSNISSVSLPLINASRNGLAAFAVIEPPANGTRSNTTILTICWGARGSQSPYHAVGIGATGIPLPAPFVPAPQPPADSSNRLDSATIAVSAAALGFALVVVIGTAKWRAQERRLRRTAQDAGPSSTSGDNAYSMAYALESPLNRE